MKDAGSDEVNEEVEQEALPLKQVERNKKNTTSSLGIWKVDTNWMAPNATINNDTKKAIGPALLYTKAFPC